MSSSTRLLVLATVRLLQPVHGYDVRRELLSWRADQWANVAPGSIYSALKVLVKDGLVEVVGTDQAGGRPARTTYRISPEGEKEMSALLREAWWNVTPPTDPFLACIALLYNLPQDEVTAAVQHRIRQLETAVESNRFIIRDIEQGTGDPRKGEVPYHVAEMMRLAQARQLAEISWAQEFLGRLESNFYTPFWTKMNEQVSHGEGT